MITKRYDKTKDEVDVTFQTHAGEVKGVSVWCDANDWQPVAMNPMGGGTWKARLHLPVDSEIQFRDLASGGAWINDEVAAAYVPNDHGTENCVVRTMRPQSP